MSKKKLKLLPLAHLQIFLSLAYYWFATTLSNPFAIGLLVLFGAHLYLAKNKVRLIFPTVFLMLNLFMFLALFSEFREFPSLTTEALGMMIVGSIFLGVNVASAVYILWYHSRTVPERQIS